MNCSDIHLILVCFAIEFGCDNARGHCWYCDLLGGTNSVHVGVSQFHLSGINVEDQIVPVHVVNSNDVIIELSDNIDRMREFSSFDPEVHLVDPNVVHSIRGCVK